MLPIIAVRRPDGGVRRRITVTSFPVIHIVAGLRHPDAHRNVREGKKFLLLQQMELRALRGISPVSTEVCPIFGAEDRFCVVSAEVSRIDLGNTRYSSFFLDTPYMGR